MLKLFKEIIIYGIGEGAARAFSVVSVIFLTHFLAPQDYGEIGLVASITAIFTIIVGLGGESTYSRWFFDYEDINEKIITTSTWLIGIGIVSSITTILLIILMPNLIQPIGIDNSKLFIVILGIAAVPFSLLNGICGQALRNSFQSVNYILFNLIYAVLNLFITIILVYYYQYGSIGVISALLINAVIFLPIRLASVSKFIAFKFDLMRFLKMAHFGIGLVITGLCYVAMNVIDRWMIEGYRSVAEVGLYSVAWSISGILLLFLSAFGQAWSPRFFEALIKNPEEASVLASRILSLTIVWFGILAIAITAFSEPILVHIIGKAFWPAINAIAPLALGVLANATTQITAIGVSIQKRPLLLTIPAGIAVLLNAALNSALIPMFGFLGAAWATCLSYVALSLVYGIMTAFLWPIRVKIIPLIKTLIAL
jgi:O-antigen/teichoic acid export membrane protein